MEDNKHAIWNQTKDFHQSGKEYGCLWRHLYGWEAETKCTPCHYAMNSFNALSEREEIYNKDHKIKAKALGYMTPKKESVSAKSKKTVAAFHDENKPQDLKQFLGKYCGKYLGSALKWLQLNEKGWHVGYILPKEHVPKKGSNNYESKGPVVNFLPRKDEKFGGYGKWYPYYHEHHHIFPIGAFRDYVIYGSDDGEEERRIKIIIASGWNINHKTNMIMLPEEVMVGRIIGLPAHKCFGELAHKEYSNSIEDDLNEIRKELNRSLDEEKDCEKTAVKDDLKSMLIDKSKEYYQKILRMGEISIDSLINLTDKRLNI